MNTYVTLTCLLVIGIIFICWLVNSHYQHEKKNYHTYDFPLDNKGKWWYN